MTLLHDLPGEATLLDALALALARAAAFNANDTVAPAAILWTDKEAQWAPIIPALRERLPLLTLGAYDPATWTGSAYWLRCAIAGVLGAEPALPPGVPVIYLPGVSRADLRAVETCPAALQPLAELQYRGVFWSHKNGKDWSIASFLQNEEVGLGLPVDGDSATQGALKLGVAVLAREPLTSLQAAAPLKAAYINGIIYPDARRSLLLWLDDPDAARAAADPETWPAFLALCAGTYNFRPEQEGAITGARKLGGRKGAWEQVWQLFTENPARYPGVIQKLAQEKPAQLSLFEEPPYQGADDLRGSWPAENERAEASLQGALARLAGETAATARTTVRDLEIHHGGRRSWVWARLGHAPLAQALAPLAELAARAELYVGGSTTAEVAALYANDAWQTDRAFLRALAAVATAPPEIRDAVHGAAGALYAPWLAAAASAFGAAVLRDGGCDYPAEPLVELGEGACLIFVDALRYDLGQELAARLRAGGHEVAVESRFAALPPVTATAKPAVTPVADRLTGGDDFNTIVAPSGPKIASAQLQKQIAAAGYQVLGGSDLGEPAGRGWTEFGQIDTYGHNNGWMVAQHGLAEVERLALRVEQLLAWGWREVVIVTDHGWLLLPVGLPTAEIPLHLTEARKGRCARLKPGAQTDEATVPWRWDPAVRIAMAADIRCYEAGKVYEHGGLSPQECVTPLLRVGKAAGAVAVAINEAQWRGLRCRVSLTDAPESAVVDLRTAAADAASSIADRLKEPDPDGTAAIFLAGERDDLIGETAYLVVTDAAGRLLAQRETTIGG